MKMLRSAAVAMVLLASAIVAHAKTDQPYGADCTGGCGMGTHIVQSSVHVYLYDPADPTGQNPDIEAGTVITGYDMSKLPKTLDTTKGWCVFDTDVPASGGCAVGSQVNDTDRKFWQTDANGYVIGPPASHQGTGGGGMTAYVVANTGATPTNTGHPYT